MGRLLCCGEVFWVTICGEFLNLSLRVLLGLSSFEFDKSFYG